MASPCQHPRGAIFGILLVSVLLAAACAAHGVAIAPRSGGIESVSRGAAASATALERGIAETTAAVFSCLRDCVSTQAEFAAEFTRIGGSGEILLCPSTSISPLEISSTFELTSDADLSIGCCGQLSFEEGGFPFLPVRPKCRIERTDASLVFLQFVAQARDVTLTLSNIVFTSSGPSGGVDSTVLIRSTNAPNIASEATAAVNPSVTFYNCRFTGIIKTDLINEGSVINIAYNLVAEPSGPVFRSLHSVYVDNRNEAPPGLASGDGRVGGTLAFFLFDDASTDGPIYIVDRSTFHNNFATGAPGPIGAIGAGAAIVAQSSAFASAVPRLEATGSFQLSNSFFRDNESNGPGGAVFLSGLENVQLAKNTFAKNQVSGSGTFNLGGGGVYISECQNVLVRDSHFIDNDAVSKGGALFISLCGPTEVKRCSFISNESTTNAGGAVAILGVIAPSSPILPVTVRKNSFSLNEAGTDGGALEIQGRLNATVTRNRFVSNTALGEGGAIFTTLGAVLEESRNFFRNNVPDDVA